MWLIVLKLILLILAIVSAIGWTEFPVFDTPTRIIVSMITITTMVEIVAYGLMINYGNNLIAYSLFDPIQFILLSIYFNFSISFYRKKHIGYIIGFIGLCLSILNWLLFKKASNIFNTNFLVFESIAIIGMSLCFFYDYLNKPINKYDDKTVHFWIAGILLFFWAVTFFRWLVVISMPDLAVKYTLSIRALTYSINIITYSAFGLVFLFYKKLQTVDRS